jgi:DNA polymerase phi
MSSSESGSEDEVDDGDDDDEDPVDPAFRQRVAEALQVSGMGIDGDVDSDEESEVWDDERMMQVDEQLAAVFKQRASTTQRTDLKRE